jgi:hypothetical protein
LGLFVCLADLLKMKRSGDIASLFQKYESKKKASSPSPSLAAAVPEEEIEEQEDGPDEDSD